MLTVPRAPDPHRLLLRALLGAYPDAALLASSTTPWASATFVGARHRITLTFVDAPAARAALVDLPEREFTLRRHLVADITGRVADAQLDVEALTVEEH